MNYWDRWPKEKQEQVKQLLSYAEMCGLTGKDLVSLGSHMDRQLTMSNSRMLMSQVHAMPITVADALGTRPWYEQKWWYMNWTITAKNGGRYIISPGDFMRFNCRSESGETRKITSYGYHPWPRHWGYVKRQTYSFALDIDNGNVLLDW